MSVYTGTPNESEITYYRIMFSKRTKYMTISCRQNFDEDDYDADDTVKNDGGEPYYFLSENLAIEYLNKWYEQNRIDPEYRMGENFSLTRKINYDINKDDNTQDEDQEEENENVDENSEF